MLGQEETFIKYSEAGEIQEIKQLIIHENT